MASFALQASLCISKVLQIKNMSPYLHPKWLIKQVEKENPFTFNEEDLKQIKSEEKLALNLKEKEIARSINFHITSWMEQEGLKGRTNKSRKGGKKLQESILDDDVSYEEEKMSSSFFYHYGALLEGKCLCTGIKSRCFQLKDMGPGPKTPFNK